MIAGRPRRGAPAVPVLIVTPRFSGERVLVRLLCAGGAFRCSGAPLGRRVARPARHLEGVLRRCSPGEAAHGAIVHPNDLWQRNGISDTVGFLGSLAARGFRVVTLARRRHEDFGLSHAICGTVEVLPASPQAVDPGEVAAFAKVGAGVERWLEGMDFERIQLSFEDDLASPGARAATLERVGSQLGLPPSPPPPEPRLPSTEALWGLVANPEELEEGLRAISASLQ